MANEVVGKRMIGTVLRHALRVALAVVLSFSASTATHAALYDNFNDNSIDSSLWTTVTHGRGVSVAETNQRLEVGLAANASNDPVLGFFGGGVYTNTVYHGDLDVTVDFQLLNWPTPSNGALASLAFHDATNPLTLYGGVARMSTGVNSPFAGEYYVGYSTSGITSWSTPTSDQSGALRLTRVGTTLSEYYLSGGQWQLLGSDSITGADLIFTINLVSNSPAFGNQAVKVAYDNVQVVPLPPALWFLASGILTFAGFIRFKRT